MANENGNIKSGLMGVRQSMITNIFFYIYRFDQKERYIKCLPQILYSCLLAQVQLLPAEKSYGNYIFGEIGIICTL